MCLWCYLSEGALSEAELANSPDGYCNHRGQGYGPAQTVSPVWVHIAPTGCQGLIVHKRADEANLEGKSRESIKPCEKKQDALMLFSLPNMSFHQIFDMTLIIIIIKSKTSSMIVRILTGVGMISTVKQLNALSNLKNTDSEKNPHLHYIFLENLKMFSFNL